MDRPPYSHLTGLRCSTTGQQHDSDQVHNLSTAGSTLLARYDLDRVRDGSRDEVAGRAPDLWRYHELLPVRARAHVVTLGEGMTPLLPAPTLGAAPRRTTAAGQGRGAAADRHRSRPAARRSACPAPRSSGVTRSRCRPTATRVPPGRRTRARAGMRMLSSMPVDAPRDHPRRDARWPAADLRLVDGLISDAGRARGRVRSRARAWFDASTLKEPYRIEGKKTMGLEIAEQLGWRVPDVIVYPTGGGVGLIGIYKALRELRELGWVDGDAAAAGLRPGDRLRPDRPRVRRRRGRVGALGRRHARSRSASPCRSRSATSWCSRRSRETGGTAIAVDDDELLADWPCAARWRVCSVPGGCGHGVRGRPAARGGLDRRRRRGRRRSTPAPATSTPTPWRSSPGDRPGRARARLTDSRSAHRHRLDLDAQARVGG